MREVFKMTMLAGPNVMNDPWEVAYGPDGFLWVNEAKGYKIHRINPTTGARTTVLDIAQGASGYLTSAQHTAYNVQFASSHNPWPQGGFAGMAVHPQFMDPVSPKNYVYVGYVHSYNGALANNYGTFFTNRIVRFTWNSSTSRLESPVTLVDTLPGSNDHNSQRMIIAPYNGVNYLFYASGDMGSGQFSNANRAIYSQDINSYEGKILRFNLEEDNDAAAFDKWIPNDNPYNGTKQSAVWSTGMRNNQGFAYLNLNGTDMLYGSSHGPFSDDEINIIKPAKNYGHPLVIGFAADNNYNNTKAGTASGSLPLISSESGNAAAIGSSYEDPVYSAYAAPNATIVSIYNNQTNNGAWPSEGWSGMDIYTQNTIPGWKNSLLVASLKWGRVLRLKLAANGTTFQQMDGSDSLSYFGSSNRYRDIALSPDGRDIFVIMDRSSTTSGPSANNPSTPACAGCVQKYTFLGYANTGSNRSTISTTIPVSEGTANTCNTSATVTIDQDNAYLWVPITGPDGNIVAEIKANGNILGTVTASYFRASGSLREDNHGRLLLNRNISLTPQNQPSSPVNVRLYITAAEYNAIVGASNSQGVSSGVTAASHLRILKNSDGCGSSMYGSPTYITPAYVEAHGAGGYVLQAEISSFSSFYFTGASMMVLPQHMITINASRKMEDVEVKFEVKPEEGISSYEVERSTDGRNFVRVHEMPAGNNPAAVSYTWTDIGAANTPGSHLYYRIRMNLHDGKRSYSRIAPVSLENRYMVEAYPNPVEDVLTVKLNSQAKDKVVIEVADLQGRIIYRKNAAVTAGNNEMKIETAGWKAQMYLVRIRNEQNRIIFRRTIIKL